MWTYAFLFSSLMVAGDTLLPHSDTDALQSAARKHLCQLSTLNWQQADGLVTALPLGLRRIDALRTLTTEALAVLMPFKAQEVRDQGGGVLRAERHQQGPHHCQSEGTAQRQRLCPWGVRLRQVFHRQAGDGKSGPLHQG
ncbi:hypothetical protein AALA54_17295 [Oscillospiraceae bacterium 44-34]